MKYVVAIVLAGCAHAPITGELLLRVQPADARVLVDDRDVGTGQMLADRPLRVRAGVRRVEVEADGYISARREANIQPNVRTELKVELHAIPN